MRVIQKHHTFIDIQTHWLDKFTSDTEHCFYDWTHLSTMRWLSRRDHSTAWFCRGGVERSLPLFLDRSPKGTVVRLALFRLDLNLVSDSFEFKFVITSGQSHHFLGIVRSRGTVTTVWNTILVRESVTFCTSGRDLYLAGNLPFVMEGVTVTQVIVGNEFVVVWNVCC